MLFQSSDEVLKRLSVLRIQKHVLPTEECEVCEDCVEVRVQAQGKCLSVVRPVNMSQGPEQQQKHFLD